jgi:hypothetical protein
VGFKKNIIAVKYSRESAQITIKKQKSGAWVAHPSPNAVLQERN